MFFFKRSWIWTSFPTGPLCLAVASPVFLRQSTVAFGRISHVSWVFAEQFWTFISTNLSRPAGGTLLAQCLTRQWIHVPGQIPGVFRSFATFSM